MVQERRRTGTDRNRTVLKTFRLPRDVEYILELEAKVRGLSVNALASMLFTKFAQWDRFASRFGYVAVSRETLRSLLELANDQQLTVSARKGGEEVPKDAVLFWFKKVSVDTFLSYLENISQFGGQAQYECEASGGEYTVTLRHELGIKWSKWLRHSIDESLRRMLAIVPQFEISESEVICRFSAPQSTSDPAVQSG
jgi:hypothetical protein